MAKYKFSHPGEWLDAKITELSMADKVDELCGMFRELASKVDGDTIQDCFQSDMDADSYFNEEKS